MKRIDLGSMDYEIGDDLRLEYNGEPFTGEAVETAGGMVIAQAFYVDGIRHGTIKQWWANGNLRSDGEVFHGTPKGVHKKWHFNGQLAQETEFSEEGEILSRRSWDELGNPVPPRRRPNVSGR